MLTRRTLVGAAAALPFASVRQARAQAPGNVVLYTSNNVEAVQVAVAALRRRTPGLNIQQVTAGTGVLMKRIEAEKDNPLGDVFWSGGFGTLGAFASHFESYVSPEIAAIPEEFRGPKAAWAGCNVHVMVIMVNSSQLKGLPAPKTWADLLADGWKGKIAITDPIRSSASYIQIYGIYKLLGLEGLKKLAANAVITGSTGQTYKGVGTGEYPAGITMEYAAYEYVDAGQRDVSLVYPTDGTFLSPEGAVLIKGAKNAASAKTLYDGFLSKEIQAALLMESFRRPTRSDIKVSDIVKLPEMSAIKVFPLDQMKAAEEYAAVIKLWTDAVADANKG